MLTTKYISLIVSIIIAAGKSDHLYTYARAFRINDNMNLHLPSVSFNAHGICLFVYFAPVLCFDIRPL